MKLNLFSLHQVYWLISFETNFICVSRQIREGSLHDLNGLIMIKLAETHRIPINYQTFLFRLVDNPSTPRTRDVHLIHKVLSADGQSCWPKFSVDELLEDVSMVRTRFVSSDECFSLRACLELHLYGNILEFACACQVGLRNVVEYLVRFCEGF